MANLFDSLKNVFQKQKEHVQPAAVKQDSTVVKYIENPSKQVQPVALVSKLQKLGIDTEMMNKNGAMDKLMAGGKTNQLIPITTTLGGVEINTEAKLSVKVDSNGTPVLCIHAVRADLAKELNKPFFGHQFTKEQKDRLLATGNAGESIVIHSDGKDQKVLVSIDRLTKEVIAIPVDSIKIPTQFKGVELNEKQQSRLKEGTAVHIEGIKSNTGNEYAGNIQYNADRERLEVVQKELNVTCIRGAKLTNKEQEQLHNGKTILVPNMVDNKGQLYSAYVRIKNKTLEFDKKGLNRKNVNVVAPTNDHRIQVAANNNGQKTEVNKYLKEPLKSKQIKPDKKSQQNM